MSQRVETSARELVSTRSSQPENGHLRKNLSTLSLYLGLQMWRWMYMHLKGDETFLLDLHTQHLNLMFF